MPLGVGVAFVIVQQTSPKQRQLFWQLLAKLSSISLQMLVGDADLAPNTAYVVPEQTAAVLADNRLRAVPLSEEGASLFPIDQLFCSLGDDKGARAIGVLLRCSGADGIQGLKHIEARGGFAMLQRPTAPLAEGLSLATSVSKSASQLVSIPDLPALLLGYATHPYTADAPGCAEPDPLMERILSIACGSRAQRFAAYARGPVMRRIQRRMAIRSVAQCAAYTCLLNSDAQERSALYQDLSLRDVEFFADPHGWECLRHAVVAPLIARAGERCLRIWVPACATGEEAYSVAMLLLDEKLKQNATCEIQVFATDTNAEVLGLARLGLYPRGVLRQIPQAYAHRFLTAEGRDGLSVRIVRAVRELLVFGEHDAIESPPIGKIDLLCCRELLGLLNPDARLGVIDKFRSSVKEGGALFLGGTADQHLLDDQFPALSAAGGLYFHPGGGGRPPAGEQKLSERQTGVLRAHEPAGIAAAAADAIKRIELRAGQLLEQIGPAAVLIDQSFATRRFWGAGEKFYACTDAALGKRLTDLLRDDLRGPVSAMLNKAITQRCAHRLSVRIRRGMRPSEASVTTLMLGDEPDIWMLVVFDDQSLRRPLIRRTAAESALIGQLVEELGETRLVRKLTEEAQQKAQEALKLSQDAVWAAEAELRTLRQELDYSRHASSGTVITLESEKRLLAERVEYLESGSEHRSDMLANSGVAILGVDDQLRVTRISSDLRHVFGIQESDIGRDIDNFPTALLGPDLADELREVRGGGRQLQRTMILGGVRYLRRVYPAAGSSFCSTSMAVLFVDLSEAPAAAVCGPAVALDPGDAAAIQVSDELFLTEERERRALANGLHDDLGQLLGTIKFKLGAIDKRGRREQPWRDIEALVDQANRSVRTLMANLSPPVLDSLGLGSAIDWIADEMDSREGLTVRVYGDELPKALGELQRAVLLRAVRQLLLKVAKHAQTHEAEVNVIAEANSITVAVSDRGFGGPALMHNRSQDGGLTSLRQRMALLGGLVSIDSVPGDGTTITLTLPLMGAGHTGGR
ncbi:PAS domain-containing protein [Niveibacterium sp. 24ML]|nr:PAS domain-containing protein [Niveibacterium sp. 24ML]